MVIYVSMKSCENPGTLAWATTCKKDQYGRPIAGGINFCSPRFTGTDIEEKWEYYMSVTIHELLHTLGFGKWGFDDFVDEGRKFSGKNKCFVIAK